MTTSAVLTLNNDNFESEVTGADLPVLVDFWATWCGPCRAVSPIVERLATEYAGRAKFGKVDVDAEKAIAQRYNVSAMPTLMVFKNGEVVEQVLGARPRRQLADLLDRHL